MNTPSTLPNSISQGPDERGFFGIYGGQFVSETLMPLILDLEKAYNEAMADPSFHEELADLHKNYVGRQSPLYFAERLTEELGGAKILSQARRAQSHRQPQDQQLHWPDPSGQAHGQDPHHRRDRGRSARGGYGHRLRSLRFSLARFIWGATDVERQAPNVFRMELLGGKVNPVTAGRGHPEGRHERGLARLGDERREYLLHHWYCRRPAFPIRALCATSKSIIGREVKDQIMAAEGRLPDMLCACLGGGSNAIGLFHPFLDDESVQIVGVEAAGYGLDTEAHCASLNAGKPGVLHGKPHLPSCRTAMARSLRAIPSLPGSIIPASVPNTPICATRVVVEYVSATDTEALEAFQMLCRTEGIIPSP